MYDCVVIGAGVIGLSIAYELAMQGMRVRVIDRNEPGRQSSWAGAGILPPANRKTAHDPYEELSALSYRLHAQWAQALRQETGIDTGYRQCGGLYVARGAGEAAALTAAVGEMRDGGIVADSVDLRHLAELEPALCAGQGPRRIRTAYLLPDERQVRNPRHLRALVTACQQRQVDVTGGVEIHHFQRNGSHASSLDTSMGIISAASFCIAAGAWACEIVSMFGASIELHPWRGQMALFTATPGLLRRIINEGPRYLVPRDDGRVLAGSTVEDVGFDKRTTADGIDGLVRFATELVPELSGTPLEKTWAGLRPGTGDGFPFLGCVPGCDNVFVATGHFRSGIFLSPATAVVMGQLIRGVVPSVDLHPFRLDRE